MSAKAAEVKVVVIATDPTGSQVAFETSGWNAAHLLRQVIEGWPNRAYGWKFERAMRLISQREVR